MIIHQQPPGLVYSLDQRRPKSAVCRPRKRERGASAIEFVLTFPALLLCIYLLIVYSIIFLVQQTMTFAAAEGARSAQIFSSATTRDQLATTRVNQILTSLPASIRSKIPAPTIQTGLAPSVCGNTQLRTIDGFACARVTINYPFATNPAIILLPGMEKLVPATLSASASALYEN